MNIPPSQLGQALSPPFAVRAEQSQLSPEEKEEILDSPFDF
jgi:hypothetical protein